MAARAGGHPTGGWTSSGGCSGTESLRFAALRVSAMDDVRRQPRDGGRAVRAACGGDPARLDSCAQPLRPFARATGGLGAGERCHWTTATLHDSPLLFDTAGRGGS